MRRVGVLRGCICRGEIPRPGGELGVIGMCRMAMARAWRRSGLGLRGLSTETGGPEKGKHVDVPLLMHGVAGKYATALFVTAVRANALDPVRSDLEQMAGVAGMDTLFTQFLKDPSVPKPTRIKACEELFKETRLHDVSKNLMFTLAENGRLAWIRPIYTNYHELLLAHQGQVSAKVTTAMELPPADLEDIKKALANSGFAGKGKTVSLSQIVDRSIIGGIVIDIGDKVIDLSIARKMKLMEKLLAEAI